MCTVSITIWRGHRRYQFEECIKHIGWSFEILEKEILRKSSCFEFIRGKTHSNKYPIASGVHRSTIHLFFSLFLYFFYPFFAVNFVSNLYASALYSRKFASFLFNVSWVKKKRRKKKYSNGITWTVETLVTPRVHFIFGQV